MTREEKAMAYAKSNQGHILHGVDIYMAYIAGAREAGWRMCEDELPTDPHQPYWVYAKSCGECCVAYLQEKTNIFYDEGGEELSGVVAWLPLPKFNPKAEKE